MTGDVYSIGLQVSSDGAVTDAIVDSPAFEAGVSSQMKIMASMAASTPRNCSRTRSSLRRTLHNRSDSSSWWTTIIEHVLLLTMTEHVTRTWYVTMSSRTISTS
jgi:hypothetical protein